MNIIKWATDKQYRLFQGKIKDVQISMWETNFRIFKARQLREESRQARDRVVEMLAHLQPKIKTAKDEELAVMKADEETLLAQKKGYEAQMFLVDAQIQGSKGVEGEEDQTGYMDVLVGLAALREQYKSYLNQI